MIRPKFTISGYRGIWGDSLNPEIVTKYIHAFTKLLQRDAKVKNLTILIGRDGRTSGVEISNLIIDELLKLGINIVDSGILSTPTIIFAVRKHKYDGAIIITASHNPIEYNGLKFINKNALFLDLSEIGKLLKYFRLVKTKTNIRKAGEKVLAQPNFSKEHIDKILENINVKAIRKRKFKIAVDMINGAACVENLYFFKQLDVELYPINDIPNGEFQHQPEPLAENLSGIARLVKEKKTDVGFAQDPDADRLVIVNEHGEVISEEYTLAIAVENILSKNENQIIAINLSSSAMNVDIARKYNSRYIFTKVGELNVVKEIISNNAIIGGEGSGGVIYPKINLARDSFVSMALILELLAKRKQTVTDLISTLPCYFIKKDKWPRRGDLKGVYRKLKLYFKGIPYVEIDGIRFNFFDGSWIHLRPSNTEPIFRLIGEAKTKKRIELLFKEVIKFL